jgi:hypothetical protein
MKDFITIAVFDYPHEVTILKHLLTGARLTFYFENETMTAIAPMYSQALGGIRLRVHPNDLEAVQEILSTLNDQTNLKIV